MGAHTGRCFRDRRRTAQRKAAQAARGHKARGRGVFLSSSPVATSFWDTLFFSMSRRAHQQRLEDQYSRNKRYQRQGLKG